MADISKSVKILFGAENKTGDAIKGIKDSLEDLEIATTKIKTSLDTISGAAVKLPTGLPEFVANIKKLSIIESKNITKVGTALKGIANLNLENINKIDSTKLAALSHISAKDLLEIAIALEQMDDADLKKLDKLNSESLKELSKIKSENIVDIAVALELIAKIPKMQDLTKFADAIHKLSTIKSTGFEKIAKGIEQLTKVNFPDYAKTNTNIIAHADSVEKLAKSYKNLNDQLENTKLKDVRKEIKSTASAIGANTKDTKKSTASFAQWGYAIGSASTGLSNLGTRLYGVSRGFSAVSKEFGIALVAFTTFFTALFALKDVIKELAQFDDAIRAAGAVAKASSQGLQEFEDAARKMGETTRYTAAESADALKELAITGLSVGESIAALPDTLNVAAAAGLKIADAADYLTNIMTGYGMTVKDLPKISDVLAASFTNANVNLQGLTNAYKQAGPIAASAGVQFEELATLLNKLGDSGYKTGRAGTILKNVMGRLLAPTNLVNEAFAKYNLSAEQIITSNTDSETGMLSLIGVFEQLRAAGISTGDALTIFGKIAGPGTIALIGQSDEAIRKMYQTLLDAQGVALTTAYEMESGLGGALRRLNALWDEVGIAIGKTIETDIIEFVEDLTSKINTNKETIVSFIETILSATAGIIKWGVEFGNLIVSFPKITIAIVSITTALVAFNVAAKLSNITGLTAGLTGLAKLNLANVGAGLTKAGASFRAMATASSGINLASLTAGFANLGKTIGIFGVTIAGVIKSLGIMVMTNLPLLASLTAIAAVAGVLYYAWDKLMPNYEKLADQSHNAAKATEELSRTLEYQLSKLELIKKGFESDYNTKEDAARLEEQLIDLLLEANIPYEKRIELLGKFKKDQSLVNEVMKEFNEELKKDLSINRLNAMAKEISAFESQKKAVSKLEASYAKLSKTKIQSNKLGYSKVGLGPTDAELDKMLTSVKKAQDKLKSLGKDVNVNLSKLADSGDSLLTITSKLNEIDLPYGGDLPKKSIDEYAASYAKMIKEHADGINVVEKAMKANGTLIPIILVNMQNAAKAYEDANKIKLSVTKDSITQIEKLEADGTISTIQAEKLKSEASVKGAKKRLDASIELVNEIQDQEDRAKDNGIKIEGELLVARQNALQAKSDANINYISLTTNGINELNDKEEEYTKNAIKLSQESKDAKSKYDDKYKSLKSQNLRDIDKLESKHAKNILSIQDNLNKELSKLSEKRTDIEKSSQTKLLGLENSLGEKLRNIGLENASDAQKDASNKATALKFLQDATTALSNASKNSDEEALKRGDSLLSQSLSLFEGLDSQSDKISGIKSVYEKLAQAEKISSKVKLDAIAKEEAEVRLKAETETKIKTTEYKKSLTTYKTVMDEKIKKAYDTASEIVKANNIEINSEKNKIELLKAEIALKMAERDLAIGSGRNVTNSDIYNQVSKNVEELTSSLEYLNQQEVSPNIDTTSMEEYQEISEEAIQKTKEIPGNIYIKADLNGAEVREFYGSLQDVGVELAALRQEGNIVIPIETSYSDAETTKVKRYIQGLREDVVINFKVEDKEQSILTTTNELASKIEQIRNKYGKIDIKTTILDFNSQVKNVTTKIDNFAKKEVKINASIDEQKLQTSVEIATQALQSIDIDKPEGLLKAKDVLDQISKTMSEAKDNNIKLNIDTQELDSFQEKIQSLDANLEENREAAVWVSGEDEIIRIESLLELLQDKTIEIKTDSFDANTQIEAIKEKIESTPKKLAYTVQVDDSGIGKFYGTVDEIEAQLEMLSEEHDVNIKTIMNSDEIKKEIDKLVQTVKDTDITLEDGGLESAKANIEEINTLISDLKILDIEGNKEFLDSLDVTLVALDSEIAKQRTLSIDVEGTDKVNALKSAIDSIPPITYKKTIHKIETQGTPPGNANGGYIDGYATGGNVFKRLASRFISKGSGSKDDVPAMLMKGEFVQKVSAVRKYGRDFMAKLNAGLIPKSIVQNFADGGNVSRFSLPFNQKYDISSIGKNLMKNMTGSMVPAYASGGFVNSNNDQMTLNFSFGNKILPVQASKSVSKELVKELNNLKRSMR